MARGVVLTNTYDEFGEIVRKNYSDGTPTVDYGSRNATGQPFSITDAAGTRSFEYDHLDRLLAARWTDGPLYGLAVTNRYDPVYDEVDRRTRATLADNSSWAYGYDDRNEVISGKRY